MADSLSNTSAEFYAISSFGIPERLYFVLLGKIKSGSISNGMYLKIHLNGSLTLPVKIHEVTQIDFFKDSSVDRLLISYCEDKDWYDFLLGMNINNEIVEVDREEDGLMH